MFGGLGLTGTARGNLVTTLTVTVTPEAGGNYLYAYTLSNSTQSDIPVVSLDLDVSANANLQALTEPTGWTTSYLPGDLTVSWQSPGSTTDLQPGASGNFTFTSKLGPGLASYTITALNETTSVIETNTGQIASPEGASVPEPTSLVLSAIGASGILLVLARRRRRPAAA